LYGMPPEAKGRYPEFIKEQFTELLTQYGPIDLVWVDQWARRPTLKAWPGIVKHIKSLQPNCIVIANNSTNFEDTDIHSYEYPWLIKSTPEEALPKEGNVYPAEVSDILGPAWFWKTKGHENKLQSADKVVEMLKLCNSRNANYILNVAPNRTGELPEATVKRLQEIGELINGAY